MSFQNFRCSFPLAIICEKICIRKEMRKWPPLFVWILVFQSHIDPPWHASILYRFCSLNCTPLVRPHNPPPHPYLLPPPCHFWEAKRTRKICWFSSYAMREKRKKKSSYNNWGFLVRNCICWIFFESADFVYYMYCLSYIREQTIRITCDNECELLSSRVEVRSTLKHTSNKWDWSVSFSLTKNQSHLKYIL